MKRKDFIDNRPVEVPKLSTKVISLIAAEVLAKMDEIADTPATRAIVVAHMRNMLKELGSLKAAEEKQSPIEISPEDYQRIMGIDREEYNRVVDALRPTPPTPTPANQIFYSSNTTRAVTDNPSDRITQDTLMDAFNRISRERNFEYRNAMTAIGNTTSESSRERTQREIHEEAMAIEEDYD
jgi:hypothetical protein